MPLPFDSVRDAVEEVEVTEEFVVVTASSDFREHRMPSTPSGPTDSRATVTASPSTDGQPTGATPTPIDASARSAVALSLAAPTVVSYEVPSTGHTALQRGAAQTVLLGAFGLDALLYMVVVPFLPTRAQGLGASPLVTSALFAMYAACLFGTTPAVGWLTDRLGARRVLLYGLLALAMATGSFAFAPNLFMLFAARGAQGAAAATTWTAGLTVAARLYPFDERPAVFSHIIIATGIGTLIGPPLGGTLYAWWGFRAPFLAVAGLVLLDGLGRLLFLPGRGALGRAPEMSHRASYAKLRHDRRFLTALLLTLVGAGLLAMVEPSIPLLLSTHFGVDPFTIGLVFGGMALLFLLIQPLVVAVTRWVGVHRGVAFGLVISAGALMLEATSATALQAEFGLTYLALGLALILLPALETLTHQGTARHASYGTIFAAYNLAYAGGQFLGPLLGGMTITLLGSARGFAVLGCIPAALGFALLWKRPRHL